MKGILHYKDYPFFLKITLQGLEYVMLEITCFNRYVEAAD